MAYNNMSDNQSWTGNSVIASTPGQKHSNYEDIFRRLDQLYDKRIPYQIVWDNITEYVTPSRGSYVYRDLRTHPERKSRFRLTSDAGIAHRKMYSKIVSEMTGTGTRWFDYRVENPDIDRKDNVRRFLQDVSDKAYSIFNQSNFRMAHVEVTSDWCAYGTACVFMDRDDSGDFRPKSVPVQQIYITEDDTGTIDTVYRKFLINWKQCVDFFGYDNIPKAAQVDYDLNPFNDCEVVHATFPNPDHVKGSSRNSHFKYCSYFGLTKYREIIKEGWYKHKPYIVFRFWKRSDEIYGGSPAIDALADIRLLNVLEESRLRSIQLAAAPPFVMAHDSVVAPIKLTPNGVNYGGMSSDGKRLIDTLFEAKMDLQALETLMDQKRQVINAAFFVDPLNNRQTSVRTAAEVQERQQETMIGIAPFLNRYEVEYLSPVLHQILQYILETDKSIKNSIPKELHGLLPTIEYTAPLAKTQRAQELQADMQFFQIIQGMAQADPTVMQVVDYHKALLRIADDLGVPQFILKTEQQVMAEKQQMAQQQQQQQQMQGLQGAANSMSQMAKSGLINRQDLGLPPSPEGQ